MIKMRLFAAAAIYLTKIFERPKVMLENSIGDRL